MAKLTGTNREIMIECCRFAQRMPAQHAVQFTCVDNASGKRVKDVVMRVFKPKKCEKYNTEGTFWVYGFLTGGATLLDNWRVFRAKFNSDAEADSCLAEVNKTLDEAYSAEIYEPGDSGDSDNGDSGSGNDGKGGNGEATNYTTYIIIGAAVLLIVLLLMKRKK